MKKVSTIIFLGICLFSNAQQKLLFNYDSAGNQTIRELCLSGCNPAAKSANNGTKEIEDLKEEDLLKFSSEDVISYYPNPVREELYLEWKLIDNNNVRSIQIFALTGQLLKKYQINSANNSQNISFQDYPVGVYAVQLYYSNGEQKSIKIIKK